MKLIAIFSIAVMFSLLICCSTADNMSDAFCANYAPGELSLGIDKKLSFDEAVALINVNGLPIEKVYTLVYRSTLPSDSISFIVNQLSKKRYVTPQSESSDSSFVYEKNDSLTLVVSFTDFDAIAQTDWDKTVTTLNLIEQPNLKSFLLAVPAGQEKDWIIKFLAQQNIAYAQLNCYSQINPYIK